MSTKSVIVDVIAWYFKVVGIIIFVVGLLLLFLDKMVINEIILKTMPYLGFLGPGVGIFSGILFLLLGVIYFLIARGLSNYKSWARMVAIILSSLQIILSLINIFSGKLSTGLFSLIIPTVIIYYLFKKEVKPSFV